MDRGAAQSYPASAFEFVNPLNASVRTNGLFAIPRLTRSDGATIWVPDKQMEPAMVREQTVNFLEAVVVFLLLTNAVSVAATAFAMRLVNAWSPKPAPATSAVERKIEALVGRST